MISHNKQNKEQEHILCSTPKNKPAIQSDRVGYEEDGTNTCCRGSPAAAQTHDAGDESSRTNHALHHEYSDGTNAAVNTEQQQNMNVLLELVRVWRIIVKAA